MASRSKAGSRSSRSGDTSFWVILGIAAFVFVDIMLVGLALTGQRAPVPTAAPDVPVSTEAASTSPSASPEPTETAPPVAAPALRLLDATSASSAWRATPGSCDAAETSEATGAVIESSTDAGVTWTSYDTGDFDIREVLALDAVNESTAFVVAKTGPECTLGFYRTFSTGDTWQEAPEELDAQSYYDPSDAPNVVIDGEPVPAPCPAVQQLVTGGASTLAVCDGAAYALDSDAGEWVGLERPNVAAVASDASVVVIEWGDPNCPALSFATMDAADLDEPVAVACAPGEAIPTTLAADQIDADLWLWQDDTTVVVPAS